MLQSQRRTVLLALVAMIASVEAIFKHQLRIKTCDSELSRGNIRVWSEPWEAAPIDLDPEWTAAYYGGTVLEMGRNQEWSKKWTSEVDLFATTMTNETDTDSAPQQIHAYIFQDMVLGGEADEICIQDIRASTLQNNGRYEVRWDYGKKFWLAGRGSKYFRDNDIEGRKVYNELQLGGCELTLTREIGRKRKVEVPTCSSSCGVPCGGKVEGGRENKAPLVKRLGTPNPQPKEEDL